MEIKKRQTREFRLGLVTATPSVLEAVQGLDLLRAIERHASGDWGDVCERDRQENDLSMREGYRLLSVYHDRNGVKFWVVTEADRSATTVLLPSEY